MSNIEVRANGHYRARYRDPNGRSQGRIFARRKDAELFLKQIEGDIIRGEFVDPHAARTSFDDWAWLWWETTIRLRPSTRRGYHGHLERHVLPYFGGRKLGSIDYMTVETFVADRLKAGLSPKMVRESVSVLSLIMGSAVQADTPPRQPSHGHHVPSQQRRIHEGDVLDMGQLHRLTTATRDPYKPAVWLLALAGLRPAELCGLRVRDVDFARHVVSVRSTLMPVHKFADEPYRVVEGLPKTLAGDRAIPVPAWLSDDLAAMLAARGTVDRDGWLFVTRYGNPINRDHFREKVMRPALRAAGLPESIRTYDLRHSHASPPDRPRSEPARHRSANGPQRPGRDAAQLRAPVRGRSGEAFRAA